VSDTPLRVVVLVSGSGTNLQALLDAATDPSYGARVVAVGADREGIEGLARAERAGVPTFVHRVKDFDGRADWDEALTASVASYDADLVVLAGFMKLVGATFLAAFGGRVLNTHPALSPSFPGMHGPAEALAYGVKVTASTPARSWPSRRCPWSRATPSSRCTSGSRPRSGRCWSTRSAGSPVRGSRSTAGWCASAGDPTSVVEPVETRYRDRTRLAQVGNHQGVPRSGDREGIDRLGALNDLEEYA
jgi:formyltetrahydrofolate-dependent phosphoribosylglycinamide formyltransferase